jgi:hypothetical protein
LPLQFGDLGLQILKFASQLLVCVDQLNDVLIHVDQLLREVGVLRCASNLGLLPSPVA